VREARCEKKKMGPSCCLDPFYSLGSKFSLTLMRVATFSLGLGLGPNLKTMATAILFYSFLFLLNFYVFFSFTLHFIIFLKIHFIILLFLLLHLFIF